MPCYEAVEAMATVQREILLQGIHFTKLWATTKRVQEAAHLKVAPTTIVRLRGVCIGLRNCSRGDSSGFGNCLGVWDFWDSQRRWGVGACGVFRLAIDGGESA